jgi:hypothetical protein
MIHISLSEKSAIWLMLVNGLGWYGGQGALSRVPDSNSKPDLFHELR